VGNRLRCVVEASLNPHLQVFRVKLLDHPLKAPQRKRLTETKPYATFHLRREA
jgi:hypothetical protein